jgi:RimJ/RimL family protein N-acetyltransferase
MLEEIVAIARERGILQIELKVHAGNAGAARFYARNGFAPYGRLPRAFRSSGGFADDVLMVRMLSA